MDKQRLVCAGHSVCVCVCVKHGYCLIGNNGRQQYLRFCLSEMYVNVVFIIRCLYSAVREMLENSALYKLFIIIIKLTNP